MARIFSMGVGTPINLPDPTGFPAAVASGSVGHTAGDLATEMPNHGDTFVDPDLNDALVIRATSTTYPASNTWGFCFGYSNGGYKISQVWESGGNEYVTIVVSAVGSDFISAGQVYLIDVRVDTGALSNERALSMDSELAAAWSLDPATPRHLFYCSGGDVRRRDTEADADDHTGVFDHFPLTHSEISAGVWLFCSVGAEPVIKWEQLGNGDIYKVHDVATETDLIESTAASPVRGGSSGINESHMNPAGTVLGLSNDADSKYYLLRISDQADLGAAPARGGGDAICVHNALSDGHASWAEDGTVEQVACPWDIDDGWGTTFQLDGTPEMYEFPGQPGSHENAGPGIGAIAGLWGMTDPNSNIGNATAGMAHNHLVMYRFSDQDLRTVAFYDGDNANGDYLDNSFGNTSADGRVIGYNSPLNGTSSVAVFLVIMPTTG